MVYDNSYEVKRAARIARLKAASEKAAAAARALRKTAHEMADIIPLGQPILRGHHSERRDTNYRKKISRKFDAAYSESKKSEYYAEKAAAAENNTAIFTDNPEAVLLLQEKLVKLEKEREKMKRINAGMRALIKNPDAKPDAIKGLRPGDYDFLVAYRAKEKPSYMGEYPYPAYALTNIGANIREVKKRIEKLSKQALATYQEETINGVQVIADPQENRVQIIFPGKPSTTTIEKLKRHGFRWAPTLGCWQRHYSAGAYNMAKEIVKIMQEENNGCN